MFVSSVFVSFDVRVDTKRAQPSVIPSTIRATHEPLIRRRYHDGIEMVPDDAGARKVFTVTTDAYRPGDQFGFAVIQAGCSRAEEAACADDPSACEHAELCDHRYDSGRATQEEEEEEEGKGGSTSPATCGWTKRIRCASNSPFARLPVESRTCVADPTGPWLNRVVPRDHDGVISAVWGSCETHPGHRDDPGCATPSPAACDALPTASSPPFGSGDGGRPPPAYYDVTHTSNGDGYGAGRTRGNVVVMGR